MTFITRTTKTGDDGSTYAHLDITNIPAIANEREAAAFLLQLVREEREALQETIVDTPSWGKAILFNWYKGHFTRQRRSEQNGEAKMSVGEPLIGELIARVLPDYKKVAGKSVRCSCYCQNTDYFLPIVALELIAESGIEEIHHREALKAEAERKTAEGRRTAQAKQLLGDADVSDAAIAFLVETLATQNRVGITAVTVVNPETLVLLGDKTIYSMSGGGCGYWSVVTVYHLGSTETREWNWRDQYDASNDRPWLRVNAIGPVEIDATPEGVTITVALVGKGTRSEAFRFAPVPPTVGTPVVPVLEAASEITFRAAVEAARENVLAELREMHARKPPMVPEPHRAVAFPSTPLLSTPYRQPIVGHAVIDAVHGVAAFEATEQIDHRVDDPQLRSRVYLVRLGSPAPVEIAEHHAYLRREYDPSYVVISVSSSEVVVAHRGRQHAIPF